MSLLRLPGLIDPHTHLREPGSTQKEDFDSGTAAALAGGFVAVLDMPNNTPPTITPEALDDKLQRAAAHSRCDLGFHFGATAENATYYAQVADRCFGLKIYMNSTHGTLLVTQLQALMRIFESWPDTRPILVHAEDVTVAEVLTLARLYRKRVHFCHISLRSEIELIARAKEQGDNITCEVSPHHLYLSVEDEQRLGPWGRMKPPLQTEDDRKTLWEYLDVVDCIATDHAPHTYEEKTGPNPPFGVPGLETSLPLMLKAVHEDRLSIERLVELMSTNPSRIFGIPLAEDTYIEVDPDEEYMLHGAEMQTRCRWTPFEGWQVRGRVCRVVLRNQVAYANGCVLATPGSGRALVPND